MWEKFRKVNGNYKLRIVPPLDRGGNTITSPDEIADIFADHYANILKDLHKKSKPGKTERRRTTIQQTNHRRRTESSHEPTKEHNIRRGYYSSPYYK